MIENSHYRSLIENKKIQIKDMLYAEKKNKTEKTKKKYMKENSNLHILDIKLFELGMEINILYIF